MKRMITTSLVLSLLILTAAPFRSQTRPRRVGRSPEVPIERPLERPVERPSNRSWMRVLLGTGIAIGSHRGGASCTPSRDIFRGRRRL